MFITPTQLLSAVASRLKVAGPGSLPDFWTDIVDQATNGSYQEIVGALLARGFSPAQIAAWDRGAEFQLSHGTYLALLNGGALEALDPRMLALLDKTAALKDVQVFTGGVWVNPQGASGPGLVGTGSADLSGGPFADDAVAPDG